MTNPLDGLLAALDLTDTGARTDEDIFTGVSQWMPHGRVFGGQVLAQSLVAAMRTTQEGRAVHSMHGYFLRPGDVNQPITFSVDRIHDGRSFSARRTQAYQNGLPILSMIASFQEPGEGLDHQIDMPSDVPGPEELKSDTEHLADFDHPVGRHWRDERPFDPRQHLAIPLIGTDAEAPLDLVAPWLQSETVLFRVRADGPLPTRLVTLDQFDGVTWRVSGQWLPVGADPAGVSGSRPDERPVAAEVIIEQLDGPWLPSLGLTATGKPMSSAASQASAALATMRPSGTGTPTAAIRRLVRSLSRAMPSAIALVRSVSAVQMRCWRLPWPSCTRLPSLSRTCGMRRSVAEATICAVLGPR